MTTGQPHVVIVGGGFAGLWAVRGLASALVRITLVDQGNHHLFQPLSAYKDYGNLATTGRMAAVVDLGKLKFSGVLAWWF